MTLTTTFYVEQDWYHYFHFTDKESEDQFRASPKAAVSVWVALTPMTNNQLPVFSRSSGICESEIRVSALLVSSEGPLLVCGRLSSPCCPHMAETLRELPGVSSIRALIPFLRTLPS